MVRGYSAVVEQYRASSGYDINDVMREARKYVQENPLSTERRLILASPTEYSHCSDVIRLREEEKRPLDYPDNEQTDAMRKRLELWNEF